MSHFPSVRSLARRARAGRLAKALMMAFVAASTATLRAVPAHATPNTPANASSPVTGRAKEEARARFDRGLALYNSGDMAGALAEFQRAYKLTGHPVVLYNLALVRASVGEAALSVEALETLKRSGWAELGASRAARAEAVYQEQLERVGTLAIQADVRGALVLIDNIDAARTPAPPQRVTAGRHTVELSAQGYEPQRLAVTVAGQAHEDITLTLVPLREALSYLELSSDVPDVTVTVDSTPLGRTPFPTEVALPPGRHELEWRHEGYVPVRRNVTLQPGTRGKLSVRMVPSDAGLASGGVLAFRLSEPNAVVTVDGLRTIEHTAGLRLPRGRHAIRVERAGFFDVERDVAVVSGANTLDVQLLPTPEYLGKYVDHARSMRVWSYVTLGAGAVAAGASTAFLLWNQGEKNAAEKAFDDYARDVRVRQGGACATDACDKSLQILSDDLAAKRDRDKFGWVGVAVGAAAMGTGVVLFAVGDAPGRYDPKPESDVFGSLRIRPSVGSLTLSGAF